MHRDALVFFVNRVENSSKKQNLIYSVQIICHSAVFLDISLPLHLAFLNGD